MSPASKPKPPATAGGNDSLRRAVTDLLLYFLIFILLFLLFSSLLTLLFRHRQFFLTADKPVVSDPMALITGESFVLLSLLIAFRLLQLFRGMPSAMLGFSFQNRAGELLVGLLLTGALYAVGFLFMYWQDAVQVAHIRFSPVTLLAGLLFFLIVAVAEEFLLRGVLLGRLLRCGMRPLFALLLTSLLFALFHIGNPNFTPLAFLNILLAGIFLGLPFLHTRNLTLSISLHWFWNWFEGPVLGYSVSGNSFGYGLIVQAPVPHSLLNGGPFGFEASLVCTFLLVFGIYFFTIYKKLNK